MSLKDLVNNRKFDKIIKMNKINFDEVFHSRFNLGHLSIIHNHKKLFNFINDRASYLFNMGDVDGLNSLHHAIKIGYFDYAEKIINNNYDILNLVDNNHENALFYLLDHPKKLKEYLTKYKNTININQLNASGETLISLILSKSDNNNIFTDMVKEILKNYKDINLRNPRGEPPFHTIIKKNDIELLNFFYQYDKELVNTYDIRYKTPIILAIELKNNYIIKKLLDWGYYIKYVGLDSSYNLLQMAYKRKDWNLVNLLSNYPFFSQEPINKNYDTFIHILSKSKYSTISEDLYYKILKNSDLNKKNVVGVTPLHVIFSNDRWLNLIPYLKEKKLDIFSKNINGVTPYDVIESTNSFEKNKNKFMAMILESYLNQLKKIENAELLYNFDAKCLQNMETCKEKLLKRIFEQKQSYPKLEKNKLDIILVKGQESNLGKFQADSTRLIYYTVALLRKHDSLILPFNYENKELLENTLYHFNNMSIIQSNNGFFTKLLGYAVSYLYTLFPLFPSLIFWQDMENYYVDSNLEYAIKRCLIKKNKRFIYFRLTLIVNSQFNHANMVIFDKEKGILERFEPYGDLSLIDNDSMIDTFLKDTIGGYLEPYLKDNKKKLRYISPSDHKNNLSFQILSNEEDMTNKKQGDPFGYCLAWSLWYLEMRLTNPDIDPIVLVKELVNEIINNHLENNQKNNRMTTKNTVFMDFIRNYSDLLDKEKNDLLKMLGVPESDYYNIDDLDDLQSEKLNKLFFKLIE